ncbi:MAG: alpha/beta hydrolase [Cyanobacteria bacterium P01_H01_bin.15]
MPYLNIRGVSHFYEWLTDPTVEPGSKPVLLFVHGWGGSARYWQSTAQHLTAYFDCLLYDLRGFGRSKCGADLPRSDEYALESYAADLNELLNQLGCDRIWINAHSMGASIATLFANQYPEKVEQLILTCSGIFNYDASAFAAFHRFGGYVVKLRFDWFLKVPGAARMFMARFLVRSIPASERLSFLADFLAAQENAALGTIYTSVSKHAVEKMPQAFAQLQMPTLLVAGAADIIIPASMGAKAAALNPQIEFIEIPRTAHFPMLEDSNTYRRIIQSFLLVPEDISGETPSANLSKIKIY